MQDEPGAPQPNAVFDESGNFLTYSSLVGIKVVNLISNVVSRVLGEEGMREGWGALTLMREGEGGISIDTVHTAALKPQPASTAEPVAAQLLQPVRIHHAPRPPPLSALQVRWRTSASCASPCASPPTPVHPAGKVENERFLRIALHQGAARKSKVTVTLETLDKIPQRDPTIMAVAFKRQRIYLLSKREPQVCTQGP